VRCGDGVLMAVAMKTLINGDWSFREDTFAKRSC